MTRLHAELDRPESRGALLPPAAAVVRPDERRPDELLQLYLGELGVLLLEEEASAAAMLRAEDVAVGLSDAELAAQ